MRVTRRLLVRRNGFGGAGFGFDSTGSGSGGLGFGWAGGGGPLGGGDGGPSGPPPRWRIPPRGTWETLASAGSAGIRLFLAQDARDSFVGMCNSGVIDPEVLGKADLGWALVLSLYHDLDSDPLRRHRDDFDAKQFKEGAKPAIQNFHEAHVRAQDRILEILEVAARTGRGSREENNVGDEDNHNRLKAKENEQDGKDDNPALAKNTATTRVDEDMTEGDSDPDVLLPWASREEEEMIFENFFSGNEALRKAMRKDLLEEEAQRDPDGPISLLRNMVTWEYLSALQVQVKAKFLAAGMREKESMTGEDDLLGTFRHPEAGSAEVENIAILSARAMEVFPPRDGEEGENENSTKSAKDTPLNDGASEKDPSLEEDEDESECPVVAQVEVLYDLKQTFYSRAAGDAESKSSQDEKIKKGMGDADGDGASTSSSDRRKLRQRKSYTSSSVVVGIFEGWLIGDPDGNKTVRWKLCMNRPAWEFAGTVPPVF